MPSLQFHKFRAVLARLVLGALVLLLIGLGLMVLFFDSLFQMIVNRASDTINGEIRTGTARLTLSGFRVPDVQVVGQDGQTIFEAPEMEVELNPWTAATQREPFALLGDVTLFQPGLRVVVDRTGTLNLSRVLRPSDDGQPPLLADYHGTITVEDGWILYRDERDAGFLYELSDWDGKAEFTPSEPAVVNFRFRPSQKDQGVLTVAGRVGVTEPMLALNLGIENLELLPFTGHPGFPPGLTLRSGVVDADLRVQAEASSFGGLADQAFPFGTLSLRKVDVKLPTIPWELSQVSGTLNLTGFAGRTERLTGLLGDIPFDLHGQLALQPEFSMSLTLVAPLIPASTLAEAVENAPPVEGTLALEAALWGTMENPEMLGVVTSERLIVQDQVLRDVAVRFEAESTVLHLQSLRAEAAGGLVTGEGWVFLGEDLEQPLLALHLEGANTQLAGLVPGVAEEADFDVNVLGTPEDPVVYGQGTLIGLGPWAQGITTAGGRFVLGDDTVWLSDATASTNGSTVRIPMATLDLESREVAAILSSEGFPVSGALIGQPGASAVFRGDVSLWGSLDDLTGITATGNLAGSSLRLDGLQATKVTGPFAFRNGELLLPSLSFQMDGQGDLRVAGSYDLDGGAADFALEGTDFDLSRVGLQGRGTVRARLTGALDGLAGFEAYLDSPAVQLASIGFRRASGELGAVAWVDALDPSALPVPLADRVDGSLNGMVAASGTLEHLSYLYNLSLTGADKLDLDFVHLSGEGVLAGDQLRLDQNLLSWRSPLDEALVNVPRLRYRGHAYPFFGPAMAPPLEVTLQPELPYHDYSMVTFEGGASLGRRRLDVEYSMAGLDLGWLASRPVLERDRSLNDLLDFDVMGGAAYLDGRVWGPFSSPRITSAVRVPWILVGGDPGQYTRPMDSYSMAAQIAFHDGTLQLDPLLVSDNTFDPRLPGVQPGPIPEEPGASMIALTGSLTMADPSPHLNLRLTSRGWEARELGIFLPPALRPMVPYGLITTDNLHIWGSLDRPSVSGRVGLDGGGLWVRGDPLPLERLVVDFQSQGGEVRVQTFDVESGPVALHGEGVRRPDGSLAASLWGSDIPLSYFDPYLPWDGGLEGEVDVAMQLETANQAPDVRVALQGQNLTWDPRIIGGEGPPVTIEELVFGRLDTDEGRPSVADGIRLTMRGGRILVEVPPEALFMRLAGDEEPAVLRAEGAVALGLPSGGLMDWFASPRGPDFGRAGVPFRFQAENLTARHLERLLGRDPTPTVAEFSGVLAMEGQWHRDHLLASGPLLPRYTLAVDELRIARPKDEQLSGFYLEEPTTLAYRRTPDVGSLLLDPANLVFFRVETPAGETEPREVVGGSLAASGSFGLMEAPGTVAPSNLTVTADNVPLANLGFALPSGLSVSGLLDSLQLRLAGPLLTPELNLTAQLADATFGPLTLARTVVGLVGGLESDGAYRVAFVGPDGGALRAYFGPTRDENQVLEMTGGAQILWRTVGEQPQDRLRPVWEGHRISASSPLDLTVRLVDRGLHIVSAMLPGPEVTSGEMRGRLALAGTIVEPELAGTFEIAGGTVRSEYLGAPLTDVNVMTRFERITPEEAEPSPFGLPEPGDLLSRYSIERFQAFLGGQPITASGKAELDGMDPTYLNVVLQGQNLPLKFGELFKGLASIDLEMVGRPGYAEGETEPTLVPLLEGQITVPQGDIDLPLSMLSGDSEDGGSPLPSLPFRYDLNVDIGSDVWVHLLESSVRIMGSLRVLPGPTGSPVLAGALALSRGTIRVPLYEATFQLRQGWAYFENSLVPELENVEATAQLGDYRVVAQVNGTYPDTLSIDLYSNPPLPEAELTRLLVLGGLPALTGGGAGGSDVGGFLTSQGVSFLTGYLTNRLTEQIGRALFLSEITFEAIPPNQYSIKLAKALDPRDRFLLTLTRVIQEDGRSLNIYGLEWRFQPDMLVRTAVDELGQPRFWYQAFYRFWGF